MISRLLPAFEPDMRERIEMDNSKSVAHNTRYARVSFHSAEMALDEALERLAENKTKRESGCHPAATEKKAG